MIRRTPNGFPKIASTAYVSDSAEIVGNVIIEDDVFIAPHATLRADEPGSSIIIRSGCNVQDGSIVHALSGTLAEIGRRSTLGHGCIVHGPCSIGEESFVGFGTVIFKSKLGERCFVMHRAVIYNVEVPPNSFVKIGQILEGPEGIENLPVVPEEYASFAGNVINVNLMLARSYSEYARG